jgi:hypothetical protein
LEFDSVDSVRVIPLDPVFTDHTGRKRVKIEDVDDPEEEDDEGEFANPW